MKQYEKYKDSGVEWLGEIPEHWTFGKLKWFSTIYAGGTPSTTIESYWKNGNIPWLNSGTVNQKRITSASNYITEEALKYSSTKWVPKGSLVMALAGQGKTKGIVAILEIDATCNQSMAAIIPNSQKCNNEFIYYWLESNYERIRGLAGSESRDGLNLELVGGIQCPLPPLTEQINISIFLNLQTSIIDQLITEKESLITKLQEKRKALINEVVTKGLNPNAPMRDSGIEWLGMIPKHWKVTKINRAFNEIGSGTTPTSGSSKYYENGDINWLNTGDLNDGVIIKTNKRITSVATKEFSTLKLYPKGSVVIALYGATIGKLGLLEIETTTNQACCVLSNSKSITQKYLFYYLYSSREHIISLAYGGGQPNISQELIKQLPILQTSIEEQSEIVEFIESRNTKIEQTISEIQIQIQKLKEYKTAVISEVVTGKVDVREWKPKNN